MIADFRFNVFNRASYDFLKEVGFEHIILSPEVSLRQGEDMVPCSMVVYGKFPVMTTQKCIIKDTAGCEKCACYLTDRTGASSYVEGIFGHRNIIYNSVPIYMADKYGEISKFSHHFIFTNENVKECENIVDAYKNKLPTDRKIRRIK
jgi:putative protease